ncbi:response regulator [Phenylobacterium sp.]|uniref:response regulator n=1 Tax=Phenylobacterium sp. TaxID=1871053 RepID=UPI0035B09B0F
MNDGRATLMLVDDEADILVALQDLFEADYEVIGFTRAADALEALSERRNVAVIVSDQRMPGMMGDAFLQEARGLSDASAILLTGYADLSAVTTALNRGGIVGYAPKPWEPDALKAMVAGAAEQHRLRRALRREQALLQGLMGHLPYAVAFKDPAGRFVYLNDRKANLLGQRQQACIGRTQQELGGAPPSEAERSAIRLRRPVQVVDEQPGAAGSSWTQIDYVPLIDATGEVQSLVVMERDITEQRVAEQQLRQSDKLRALGTLAGGVAHDFNNLLTAIVGSLELATKRLGDATAVRRYLDNATLAAQRGASLTQRLLGFSRRSDGEAVTVDIAEVLRGTRDLLARTLGGAVGVEWRIADGLWSVSIEADQLEVALLNLAVNARDAMPNGGQITIQARNVDVSPDDADADLTAGDYVVLTVADTGEGMPPEILERILEPFFTTKPVGKGTGLGLPMVYGFAQRSGGALRIRSVLGAGTQVSLFLPRANEAGDPSAHGPATLATAARCRILVIDDEPGVRTVTAASLRDMGHEVLEAHDPAAALDVVDRADCEIDLAIVDFAMPGMNGLEFIERAREIRRDLPAILLTGYYSVETAPPGVLVVHKPFTQPTLEAAIASIQAVADDAVTGETTA